MNIIEPKARKESIRIMEGMRFPDEFESLAEFTLQETSTGAPDKGDLNYLANRYMKGNKDVQDGIDMALMSITGWTFPGLLEGWARSVGG